MAVITPSFEPVRSQWRGLHTGAHPPTAPLQRGAWWYRTDWRVFCYWDGAMVHCWGGIGGLMLYGTAQLVCSAAGNYVLNVTLNTPWVPIMINRIVSVYSINTSPVTDPGTPTGIVANVPVVGFTLIGVGQGTTLNVGVIAMGW